MDALHAESASVAERPAAPAPAWLPPSAALNRFRPAAGGVVPGGRLERPEVRYGFRVASLGFLIRAGVGSEVLPMVPICAIPNGSPWLLGMVNLRSTLVPVFDLATPCALDRAQHRQSPAILVLDRGANAIGIVIDGFPKALSGLRPVDRLPRLPTALRGYIAGGHMLDGELWLDFDHEGFFGSLAVGARPAPA